MREPEAERSFLELRRAVRERVGAADLLHAHRYKESVLSATLGRPWVATQHGRPESFAGREELRMRLYFPQELDALLQLSGFAIEAKYGNYDDSPFASNTPKQLVICEAS